LRGLAYQLVVESPRIPEWFDDAPRSRASDVVVEIIERSTLRVSESRPTAPPTQFLSYPSLADVWITDGKAVSVRLHAGVPDETLDLLLSGPVFGVLLHQRGALVQHAAAVAHHGSALVFTGGSTWGKSTTVASLYRRGFPTVADDVVPLTASPSGVTTVPGYPAVKLWPEAARSLGLDPASMPKIGLEGEKRRLDTRRGFGVEQLPVRRIYVLAKGDETRIELLRGRDAFVEVVLHSYLARYLGDPQQQSRRFEQAEHVIRHVEVRRLVQGPVEDLGRLPDLIASDLG
jgi:hypothetical protein